jgi:Mor family transcriptional regulator
MKIDIELVKQKILERQRLSDIADELFIGYRTLQKFLNKNGISARNLRAEQIYKLHKLGKTITQISAIVPYSHDTIYKIIKRVKNKQ